LILAKNPEVSLQFLVDPCKLAISLGMIGSREGDVIGEESGQFFRKGRGKLWTALRDYFVMETKVGKDMFEKQGSVDSFVTRDENHLLCKPMVDHDQNRVKIRGEWKIHDHVTGNLLEWAGGGG